MWIEYKWTSRKVWSRLFDFDRSVYSYMQRGVMYIIPMPCCTCCRPRLPRFAYRRTKQKKKSNEKKKTDKICKQADNIGPMPVAVPRTMHHVSTTWTCTHGCVNSFLSVCFFFCAFSTFLLVVLLLFILILFVICTSFNECFISYEFSNLYVRGSVYTFSPYAYIFWFGVHSFSSL